MQKQNLFNVINLTVGLWRKMFVTIVVAFSLSWPHQMFVLIGREQGLSVAYSRDGLIPE